MNDLKQPEVLRLAKTLESLGLVGRADLIRMQHYRIMELESALFAYASEFKTNSEGDPDIGSIHQNIRGLKAENASMRDECEVLIGEAVRRGEEIASLRAQLQPSDDSDEQMDCDIARYIEMGDAEQHDEAIGGGNAD